MSFEDDVENGEESCTLLDLPEEILAKVFRYLDSKSLKSLKLVHSKCKFVVDVWCKLNLVFSYSNLDEQRPPIAKYRLTTERFDRVIFHNVKFGTNYQTFLWDICTRTKKITINANDYISENGVRFQQIREIVSACPELDELELRLHVIKVTTATDEAFLRNTLQSITKFKYKGEFQFVDCKTPVSRLFQWLSRGQVTHLLWSKMGSKVFGSHLTFHMHDDDKMYLVREIVNFLRRRKDHLKTFWVDGFWEHVATDARHDVLDALMQCSSLEQVLLKVTDWPEAVRCAAKMTNLRHVRVDLKHNDDHEKFLPFFADSLTQLKVFELTGGER